MISADGSALTAVRKRTLKRLTFTKEKDGSIKIRGALVGFPDEVSIGEATAQPYAERRNKSTPDTMLATFSSEKYKPFMVLNSNPIGSSKPAQIQFTCYMTDVDGSKIHLNGYLNREPDTTGK